MSTVNRRLWQPRAPSALTNWRSWTCRPAKNTVSASVSQIRWVICSKVLAVVPSSYGSFREVNSCGSYFDPFSSVLNADFRVSV